MGRLGVGCARAVELVRTGKENSNTVNSLVFVLPWVFGSVAVGLAAGYYLGLGKVPAKDTEKTEQERDAALAVLSELLEATQQLTSDVNERNVEIREVGQSLSNIHVDGELQEIQQQLMKQVTHVLESNVRLEDDLSYTRMQVKHQAIEIDRTQKEARTDVLSGVGNRKGLEERLELMLSTYRRGGDPFVLLFADIDHFKWINDTHGHEAGDHVVTHVGDFLNRCVRDEDFVARYGGDEFVLLFAGLDLATAAEAAERIRSKIANRNFGFDAATDQSAVTFSIGVAAAWTDATPADLLRHADLAVYQSKRQGRNQVYCCTEDGTLLSVSQVLAPAESSESPSPESPSPESQASESETEPLVGATLENASETVLTASPATEVPR